MTIFGIIKGRRHGVHIDFLSSMSRGGDFNLATSVLKVPPDVVELVTMTGAKLFLVSSVINIVSAIESGSRGCNLVIPKDVQEQPEPQAETGPLLLHLFLRVTGVRDIPNSGGSYGVDVWQVFYLKRNKFVPNVSCFKGSNCHGWMNGTWQEMNTEQLNVSPIMSCGPHKTSFGYQ